VAIIKNIIKDNKNIFKTINKYITFFIFEDEYKKVLKLRKKKLFGLDFSITFEKELKPHEKGLVFFSCLSLLFHDVSL